MITLEDCPCANRIPHKNFYEDGIPLCSNGFFTVQMGEYVLSSLVREGHIPLSEAKRLFGALEVSGLPSEEIRDLSEVLTEDPAVVLLSKVLSYYSPHALECELRIAVQQRQITLEQTVVIREKIAKMTEEEKIYGAARAYSTLKRSSCKVKEKFLEPAAPELRERIWKLGEEMSAPEYVPGCERVMLTTMSVTM